MCFSIINNDIIPSPSHTVSSNFLRIKKAYISIRCYTEN